MTQKGDYYEGPIPLRTWEGSRSGFDLCPELPGNRTFRKLVRNRNPWSAALSDFTFEHLLLSARFQKEGHLS